MPIFLMFPALFAASIAIPAIGIVLGTMAIDNALGGPISRAGAKWVDADEREKFKDSDLYKRK